MSPLAEDYTVAWICYRDIERAAAIAMLEKKYKPPASFKDPTANMYSFGSIHGHKIVIVCSSSAIPGVNWSGHVVISLRQKFRSVTSYLLVGLGSGVPRQEHDVRLGDVVVGVPTTTRLAVVGLKLSEKDNSWRQEGPFSSPSKCLLSAVSLLQARPNGHNPDIRGRITASFAKDAGFKADYDHSKPEYDMLYTTSSNGEKRSTLRKPRGFSTIIHYGSIASVPYSINDRHTRDTLADRYDVLCIETEAASVLPFAPALVIRGVCNYADEQRDHGGWQRHAALTAAAYAAELVSLISPLETIPLQTISGMSTEEEEAISMVVHEIHGQLESLNFMIPSFDVGFIPALQLERCLFILRQAVFAVPNIRWLVREDQVYIAANLLGRISAQMQKMVILAHVYPRGGQAKVRNIPFEWITQDMHRMAGFITELCKETVKLVRFVIMNNLAILPDVGSTLAYTEDLILVMGSEGAGKSRFIQQITGSSNVKTTPAFVGHSVLLEGRTATLIDTPEFEDAGLPDASVLTELACWMALTYSKGYRLLGILYLTPITAPTTPDEPFLGFEVLRNLIGRAFASNIILVTTGWDLLQSGQVGEAREAQLENAFWDDILDVRNHTMRSFGDETTATAIATALVSQREPSSINTSLTIQREMVEEDKHLANTAAGMVFLSHLAKMIRNYDEQSRKIEEETVMLWLQTRDEKSNGDSRASFEAFKASEKGTELIRNSQSMRSQIHLLQAQKDILIKSQDFDTQYRHVMNIRNLDRYLRRKTRAIPRMTESLFSWQAVPLTISAAQAILMFYKRYTRPKLREGYSRIEWICECGDILVADIKQNSEGSLRTLAEKLNGTLSGSAAQRYVAVSTSSSTASGITVAGASSSVQHSALVPSQNAANPTNPDLHQGADPSPSHRPGSTTTVGISNVTPNTLFLELCIRSDQETHNLEELDITGNRTDRDIFSRIRDSYDRIRPPLIFGIWKSRRRKGGIFVKFRRDKHPRNDGQATASIFKRNCTPSAAEKTQFDYDFDPVPMDEPPMPVDTFNHYLGKPHRAETVAAWVSRFPKLKGPSLKYNNDILPQGWGIEIVETRNWTLFAFANAFVLFLSGAVAAIFAIFSDDRQTAVAIGTWLTTVQAICVSALLFLWTND